MDKIITIIFKEWSEVFKNKLVLFTTLFLPLFFTGMLLLFLFFTGTPQADEALAELPLPMDQICPAGISASECLQYYMTTQFMMMFMMLPVIIPVNIAAYSIVGEKTTRSLEPLLATPISTIELVTGKNLAAVIPAVLATWLGYLIFMIGAFVMTGSQSLVMAFLDPLWLVAIFIIGPGLAIISVNFAVMVSSRVNDPRVAEQLAVVVILPLLLLLFGQLSGFIVLNRTLMIIFAMVVLTFDAILVPLAVRLFQRETILTRWR